MNQKQVSEYVVGIYCRLSNDVSKKIKFTVRAKAKNGEARGTARPLYGYMYNEAKERIPDPETAPIVKRIFQLYSELKSSTLVAKLLNEEKIYCPNYYNFLKRGDHYEKYSNCDEDAKYKWIPESINHMLNNKEYLGHYITQKNLKQSFKSKKIIKTKIHMFLKTSMKL